MHEGMYMPDRLRESTTAPSPKLVRVLLLELLYRCSTPMCFMYMGVLRSSKNNSSEAELTTGYLRHSGAGRGGQVAVEDLTSLGRIQDLKCYRSQPWIDYMTRQTRRE